MYLGSAGELGEHILRQSGFVVRRFQWIPLASQEFTNGSSSCTAQ